MGVGDGLNEQRTVNSSPESTVIVSDRTNAAATGSADGGSLSDSPLEQMGFEPSVPRRAATAALAAYPVAAVHFGVVYSA